jgi:hypothetical protein
MLRVKGAGLVVMTVCAVGLTCVYTSVAAATPTWHEDGVELTSALAVNSTLKLTIPLETSHTLECAGVTSGSIGAGGIGEVEKVEEALGGSTHIKCTTTSKQCRSPYITGVNLPWNTTLYTEAGETRNAIESSGAGEPELGITCEIQHLFYTDYCSVPSSVHVENASPNVDESFDEKGKSNCGTGIRGTNVVEAPAGHVIEVK